MFFIQMLIPNKRKTYKYSLMQLTSSRDRIDQYYMAILDYATKSIEAYFDVSHSRKRYAFTEKEQLQVNSHR